MARASRARLRRHPGHRHRRVAGLCHPFDQRGRLQRIFHGRQKPVRPGRRAGGRARSAVRRKRLSMAGAARRRGHGFARAGTAGRGGRQKRWRPAAHPGARRLPRRLHFARPDRRARRRPAFRHPGRRRRLFIAGRLALARGGAGRHDCPAIGHGPGAAARGRFAAARARRPAHRRDGYRRGAVALQQTGQAVAHRPETASGRQPRRLPGGSRAHAGSAISGAFPGGPAQRRKPE